MLLDGFSACGWAEKAGRDLPSDTGKENRRECGGDSQGD